MSAEARQWLAYARENRQVAALCQDSGLFNPSLQNAQQAGEKALKTMGLAAGMPFKKTHSIGELRRGLLDIGLDPGLTEDEADLLNTIYLPSKYPLGSVLPAFEPDAQTAEHCLAIVDRVMRDDAAVITFPKDEGALHPRYYPALEESVSG
jgi:HEPN domain-containing protein